MGGLAGMGARCFLHSVGQSLRKWAKLLMRRSSEVIKRSQSRDILFKRRNRIIHRT